MISSVVLSRSTLKGSNKTVEQEAQQVGTDLLRKQSIPKERAEEDRKGVPNIAREVRVNRRTHGR